jgi:hypothetical protein
MLSSHFSHNPYCGGKRIRQAKRRRLREAKRGYEAKKWGYFCSVRRQQLRLENQETEFLPDHWLGCAILPSRPIDQLGAINEAIAQGKPSLFGCDSEPVAGVGSMPPGNITLANWNPASRESLYSEEENSGYFTGFSRWTRVFVVLAHSVSRAVNRFARLGLNDPTKRKQPRRKPWLSS